MLQIKNQDSKSFTIRNKAFSGFIISAVTIADDFPATPVTNMTMIDPYKVRISLRNNLTSREVFSESLAQMLRRTKKGDRDLYNILHGTLAQKAMDLEGDAQTVYADYSLDFGDTYEGDYTFTIQTNDAMSPNFTSSSHLEVSPMYSDEPMIYEAIYLDKSLEGRISDLELGNGIEEIQFIEGTTMLTQHAREIKQVAVNHAGGKQIFSKALVQTHSNSLHEAGVEQQGGDLLIHDGEVLSSCAIHVELEAAIVTGVPVILYKKLIPNFNAEASVARADNRYERTWGLIDQGL